jgi:hypothetical protein
LTDLHCSVYGLAMFPDQNTLLAIGIDKGAMFSSQFNRWILKRLRATSAASCFYRKFPIQSCIIEENKNLYLVCCHS